MLPIIKTLRSVCAFAGCGVLFTVIAGIAQQSATEAPAGFHTPSFNAGASISNGIEQPAADSFVLDQQLFERNHQEKSDMPSETGLGPVYNGTACVNCHENPNTGGASQITELRVGHRDASGNFVNPTIYINHGNDVIKGRSIVNDRATCPEAEEHIPDTENIRALRAVLNTLGDGFVEAIDDNTLLAIAAAQPRQSGGRIHGEPVMVSLFEAPGQRIGRFGWKDQHGSLLSFSADAYLNEMGVTSRLRPTDVTTVCKKTSDPEDVPDALGLADIDHFAQFIRGTMVPPPDAEEAQTPSAMHGLILFGRLGCDVCHVPNIVTAPPGTPEVIVPPGTTADPRVFKVPAALGNKVIHPYSDFLLHDVGTGDGIVQGGPQDTANKLRTVPLWGLRTKSRFMHDLRSLSLENAIMRHKGEAAEPAEEFRELSPQNKQDLLNFLNSL